MDDPNCPTVRSLDDNLGDAVDFKIDPEFKR